MGPKQGWFESDEDYRSRVAQEADERTIENSTDSAPSQGWFESNDSYRERIAQEANEHRIEDSTGETPSQGWFESNDSYRERIAQEANERTIEDSTGEAPSQGWFESDCDYDTRVRKEANEYIVKGDTGSSPKQGWFEGDHDYRSRIAHEARKARASNSPAVYTDFSSDYSTSPSYGPSGISSESSSSGLFWVIIFVVGLLVAALLSWKDTEQQNAVVPQHQPAYTPLAQQRAMEVAQKTWEEELRKNADKDAGTEAYKAGRFNDALALLKPLAEDGDAWAQHLLGMMHLNPYEVSGFSKDILEADNWFTKAAEQGLDLAQHSLGQRCFRQEGASKDYAECARWLRKAAEQGHANAQHDLADMYSEGVGVQRDQLEAKEWYRKAAAQGHKQAQLKLQKIEHSNAPLYERELWPGGPKFVIEPPEWR